jgi:hypothetical protein
MPGLFNCGGGGIRTPGDREASTVFKTAAFDHSATPPVDRIRPLPVRKHLIQSQKSQL